MLGPQLRFPSSLFFPDTFKKKANIGPLQCLSVQTKNFVLFMLFSKGQNALKCMFLHPFPDDTNMKRKTLRNALCNVGMY